jgi:lysophospholipase L1-like esterase
MMMFVYDYDFNSPSNVHLQETHEKLYRAVRESHPDIPIVLLSRPKPYLADFEIGRREIIRTTYLNAKARGENVYFISGEDLMQYAGDSGLVDGVHPNDLGFASMARVLGDLLKKLV